MLLHAVGERVVSRDFERNVAEPQIGAAIPNRFTAFGKPLTQHAGQVCPAQGKLQPSCATRDKALPHA
ncbi:MAG: hypothetical protein B7Z52_00620 [Burkholderiales bacterium 12-64-5]|nr:MAG: hypothetical protein B7Z52_00620 [Burkholderiales bacterium 12-64-5]